MKPIPVFYGVVEPNAVISFDNPQLYARFISQLEGKRVEVRIKQERTIRSLQQNSYYWGVVVNLIADHCGYDPDECHEALKLKFLSPLTKDEYGLVRIGSTTKLSTEEFAEYLNRVVRWAAQYLQVFIPDPSQAEV